MNWTESGIPFVLLVWSEPTSRGGRVDRSTTPTPPPSMTDRLNWCTVSDPARPPSRSVDSPPSLNPRGLGMILRQT